MNVLMHIDPLEPSRLLGIWVVLDPNGAVIKAWYPKGTAEAEREAALTLDEKVPQVTWPSYFRQLAERLPLQIWWETTEVDETTDLAALFVSLSAQVLTSAAAAHGGTSSPDHSELQFTVTMFSTEEADRLGLTEGSAMNSLPNALLEEHAVLVSSDNPFQQRARLLQALWREAQELPIGTRDNKTGGAPLGSRLDAEGANPETGNFLSADVRRRVRRDVQAPDRDRDRLFATPRLYCDLLSSQPLCFNLFAELDADRVLATEVFRALLPGTVDEVSHIEFEYSPGRRSANYLGNRSAFDVFVVHTTPSGGWGFVGIEVKYHENMNVAKANMEGKPYLARATAARCFATDALPKLEEPPLQQIWLDHLLALSMLQHDHEWETGRFVMLAPARNQRCSDAVEQYASYLTDTPTFASWSLEKVHGEIASRSSSDWVGEFYERYLDFDKVEP